MIDRIIVKLKRLYPTTGKFTINEGLVENIIRGLRGVSKPNLAKVAHENGVPIGLVRVVYDELPVTSSSFTRLSEDGWGRQELRDYIVSRKKVDGSWPDSDNKIIVEARQKYDDGLIELCQGRDGDFTILYAIPRRSIIRRRPYFVNMELM